MRALVTRARAARARDILGIRSYEGLLRERIYVGITSFSFRRERGLFDQERVARIRWSDDDERAIQWIGARRAVPIVGADTRDAAVEAQARRGRRDRGAAGSGIRGELAREMENEAAADLAEELPAELLRESRLPSFPFDPNDDRLAFGQDWALHPLADSALAHYRYLPGDTLRLTLPDRQIVLLEVRVQPRRADFHLVAGSLWFDAETASLVRATYKPARPFDMALDEPDEEVPGWLGPVQAELDYITVEYSLHEDRFWLPRRFALEGEARLGSLFRIPLTVEWTVSQYEVNEETTRLAVVGPLPRGWSRRSQRVEEPDGSVHYVTVVVPEADSLLTSPVLSEEAAPRSPSAFSADELDDLQRDLNGLLPTWNRFRPRVAFGLGRGLLRYNRVEGLGVGARATVPLTPRTTLEAEVRTGTSSQDLRGQATLRRGTDADGWHLTGYRRLQSMNELEDPFSLPGSVVALVLGTDRGQFYRATGGAVGMVRTGANVRREIELFHERQEPVSLGTDFYLTEFFREEEPVPVLAADDVALTGVRGTLQWFHGTDPDGLVLTGGLRGEAAWGDAEYQRLAARVSAGHPLPFGLAGALELAAGTSWTDAALPLQRSFFLGGSATLRGFNVNEIRGDTFWRARGEVATGFAGARLVAFGDLGWAGPRDQATLDARLASVGVGTSLLDGLFRIDLARAVRGDSRWKVHFYLDGLF